MAAQDCPARDGTYEVVQSCLEKELTGFGELFRYLSYAEIGAAAMMSRATAGVAHGTVIISMPGSTAAVRLAMEKLVLPELTHMTHITRLGAYGLRTGTKPAIFLINLQAQQAKSDFN